MRFNYSPETTNCNHHVGAWNELFGTLQSPRPLFPVGAPYRDMFSICSKDEEHRKQSSKLEGGLQPSPPRTVRWGKGEIQHWAKILLSNSNVGSKPQIWMEKKRQNLHLAWGTRDEEIVQAARRRDVLERGSSYKREDEARGAEDLSGEFNMPKSTWPWQN